MDICTSEITDPAAWTSRQLLADETWIWTFSEDDLADFDAALDLVRGVAILDIQAEDFPLPHFGGVLREVARELECGRGIALLRGLPVHFRYTEVDAARIYWAVGRHLGSISPQNRRGDLLDAVAYDPAMVGGVRGYYSKRANDFHCDPSDVIGLFSLRQAKAGGISMVASSLSMHNVMRDERPDLLEELYEPMAMDWMDEEPSGSARFYLAPVFQYLHGLVSCRNITRAIRRAQRLPEVPRLSAAQVEALYFIEPIAYRNDLHVEYLLQPGDMQFLNNYVVSHARTSYENDDRDPMFQRRLLRLWISCPQWTRSDGTSHYGRPV